MAHFDAVDEGDGSGGRSILVDVSVSDTDGSLCMKGKKKME